jgi:hypothetical protein
MTVCDIKTMMKIMELMEFIIKRGEKVKKKIKN